MNKYNDNEVEDDADDTPFYQESIIQKKPSKLTKNKIKELRKQLEELSRKLEEILDNYEKQPYEKQPHKKRK